MPLSSSYRTDFSGYYFDGKSPLRRDVTVTVTREGLRILNNDDQSIILWSFSDIKQVNDIYTEEEIRLEYGNELPQILIIKDPRFINSVKEISPKFNKRFKPFVTKSKRTKILVYIFISATLISGLMYIWVLPALGNLIVKKIPVTWEVKIGQNFKKYFVSEFNKCEEKELNEKLVLIKNKLENTIQDSNYKYDITIVDFDMVNAFALPGGEIVIFRGLIEKSNRPEELAGVLAHEIQHIEQRHFTKILVKELSIHVLIAIMIGNSEVVNTVVMSANTLRSLAYRRSEESSADTEGLKMLVDARIDPGGMIDFFKILESEHGEIEGYNKYISTHPDTEDRIGKLDNMIKGYSFKPEKLLPDVNWEEAKMLCSKTKESNDVKIDEEEN